MREKDIVKIRSRNLTDGSQSIYLEYYENNGRRFCKAQRKYIIPGMSKEQKDEIWKEIYQIKAQKTLELLDDGTEGNIQAKNKTLLIDWMKHCRDEKIRNGKRILSTYNNTIKLLKAFRGDDVLLKDVDVKYCMDFYHYLLTTPTKKTGKPLAKSSIAIYCTCLNTALNLAERDYFISANPCKRISPYDKVRGPRRRRIEHLEESELKKIATTPCRCEEVKTAFLFACECGLRVSDIRQLRWGDIKLRTNGTYMIEKGIQKTDTYIYHPLPDDALDLLLPMRYDLVKDSTQLIFATLPSEVTINAILKEWFSRAGIERAMSLSFRVSRSTYATILISKGVDIYTVSKLMAHENVSTTQVYAYVSDEKKASATKLLNGLFK